MNTNFFQTLSAFKVEGDWQITIKTAANDMMLVSVLFTSEKSGDNARKLIPPMLLKGTAQELDEGFFPSIETPVKKTAELFFNMEEYLKELEKSRLASKMFQDKAKAAKAKNEPKKTTENADEDEEDETEPVISRQEKQKQYAELIRQLKELESGCKYEEALAILPSVTDYPNQEAEINKHKADLERRIQQKKQLLFNE